MSVRKSIAIVLILALVLTSLSISAVEVCAEEDVFLDDDLMASSADECMIIENEGDVLSEFSYDYDTEYDISEDTKIYSVKNVLTDSDFLGGTLEENYVNIGMEKADIDDSFYMKRNQGFIQVLVGIVLYGVWMIVAH